MVQELASYQTDRSTKRSVDLLQKKDMSFVSSSPYYNDPPLEPEIVREASTQATDMRERLQQVHQQSHLKPGYATHEQPNMTTSNNSMMMMRMMMMEPTSTEASDPSIGQPMQSHAPNQLPYTTPQTSMPSIGQPYGHQPSNGSIESCQGQPQPQYGTSSSFGMAQGQQPPPPPPQHGLAYGTTQTNMPSQAYASTTPAMANPYQPSNIYRPEELLLTTGSGSDTEAHSWILSILNKSGALFKETSKSLASMLGLDDTNGTSQSYSEATGFGHNRTANDDGVVAEKRNLLDHINAKLAQWTSNPTGPGSASEFAFLAKMRDSLTWLLDGNGGYMEPVSRASYDNLTQHGGAPYGVTHQSSQSPYGVAAMANQTTQGLQCAGWRPIMRPIPIRSPAFGAFVEGLIQNPQCLLQDPLVQLTPVLTRLFLSQYPGMQGPGMVPMLFTDAEVTDLLMLYPQLQVFRNTFVPDNIPDAAVFWGRVFLFYWIYANTGGLLPSCPQLYGSSGSSSGGDSSLVPPPSSASLYPPPPPSGYSQSGGSSYQSVPSVPTSSSSLGSHGAPPYPASTLTPPVQPRAGYANPLTTIPSEVRSMQSSSGDGGVTHNLPNALGIHHLPSPGLDDYTSPNLL